jgi:hypothetical protein
MPAATAQSGKCDISAEYVEAILPGDFLCLLLVRILNYCISFRLQNLLLKIYFPNRKLILLSLRITILA